MNSMKIAGEAGAETRVAILESGEEAFATLAKFANDTGIKWMCQTSASILGKKSIDSVRARSRGRQ